MDVEHRYEQLAGDILIRLQVCFPEYRLQSEVWERGGHGFVTFHLSSDGRDEWVELVPDRSGDERRVKMQSFHLQTPFPPHWKHPQLFRQHIVQRFIREWFDDRMRRAGLEP